MFGYDYFEELLERIRDILASERLFYQKITDIYAQCSIDYNSESAITKEFYATVQNKLHWAIHGHTAAEIIAERVDVTKPQMGLTTWKNAPKGKIRKSDVTIAKNYLTETELRQMNRIVTMYLDKPMQGHGLMQTIARVNRVYKDKPGGLIVDYLGIAGELRKALAAYTDSGGKGKPSFDQREAIEIMLEKYEIVAGMYEGFDYKRFFAATVRDKMSILIQASEFILAQDKGKERYLSYVTQLSQAFALSVPAEEALKLRDVVGFFQAVRSRIAKLITSEGKTEDELDSAIRQIISKAIATEQVIDTFSAAGLKKPDISILSDEFLEEVRRMPYKNLALELLKKLLNDEIKSRSRKNLIQGRSFAEMLEKSIRKYQNKAIEAVKVIEELIELGKMMREAGKRGEDLGLSEDELAFYDALEVNDSAVKVLGDATLRHIAQELVEAVRKNVKIDWTLRDNVQAKIRVFVRRISRKYGYPPDKQQQATDTVLEQAALIAKDWAEKN